jgi:hypothetical protein
MKLRTLCKKVTADFLQSTKSAIQIELARDPITITYEEALTTFRNQVNLKFPPELSAHHNCNRSRRINEMNARAGARGRGGRGRFGRGGSSRYQGSRQGGYGGRGRGRGNYNNRRKRNDTRMVRCTDGTEVKVHASYKFDDRTWNLLPDAERNRIIQERSDYKRGRHGGGPDDRSTISQITTGTAQQGNDLQSVVQSVQQLQMQISNMSNNSNDGNDTPPTSIMGGRNEQASLRSRNRN